MRPYRFFVIDDSDLDCYIAEKKIAHFIPQAEVFSYKEARDVLDKISVEGEVVDQFSRTIILLDILMPLMDGYAFMEAFEKFDLILRDKFLVIAITSSMYKNQIGKIYSYPGIKGVLEKPFTVEDLEKVLADEGITALSS